MNRTTTVTARAVSYVLQPIFIPTFGIIMLLTGDAALSILPAAYRISIAAAIFITTGVVPALIVLLGMMTGNVSDGFISQRRERTWPYIVSLLGYTGCCLWLWHIHMPQFYIAPMIGSTISLMLITIINLWWKISAHGASMGGLAGGIIAWSILSGTDPLWLICLTILLGGIVGWSRILLKAHTPAQYCCGWLLGFISVATSWLLV